MKKIYLSFILAAFLLLFAACQGNSVSTKEPDKKPSSAQPTQGQESSTTEVVEKTFAFHSGGNAFSIGQPLAEIANALSNAEKSEDALAIGEKTVAIEQYTTEGFVVSVDKESGRLVSIKLTAPECRTDEGLGIGAVEQIAFALYGQPIATKAEYRSYLFGETELRMYIENGRVTALFYLDAALFENADPESVPVKETVYFDLQIDGTGSIPVELFLKRPSENSAILTDLSTIDLSKEGQYPVEIAYNNKKYSSVLYLTDMSAPTATAVEGIKVIQGGTLLAEALVKDIVDCSEVTVSLKEKPSTATVGALTVTVVLTDAKNNTNELPVTVEVIADKELPIITASYGMVRTVYVGEAISYKKGITVTDNSGAELSFTVDASAVKQDVVGNYPVIYTTTDAAGNKGTLRVLFCVVESSEESADAAEIYAYAEKILREKVFKGTGEELTEYQKCHKIYWWVKQNLGYSGKSEKKDWLNTGYKVLTGKIGSGDCFTYYSAGKLLLTAAGIENIDVYKVKNYEGDSNHYWSMVYVYDAWYHFDCCPRNARLLEEKTGLVYKQSAVNGSPFLLFTDAQMDFVSERMNNCFNRDMSLYPKTPETPLPEEYRKK